MLIGYARVSTEHQSLDLQMDALTKEGCTRIFHDTLSGSIKEKTNLDHALSYARKGDTLIVWRLDRLGRSLKHLIALFSLLEERGIAIRSLQEQIDTSSPSGKLIFHVFASLAEFERNLIRERTKAGLDAARSRGKLGGRPKKLFGEKEERLRTLYNEKKLSIKELCTMFHISKGTLYRTLRSEEKEQRKQ